jgi:ABC-type branched-subunit amino acid transport system permease subunit
MLSPGTIYYAIWIAVLVSALLTMNLLDSRTGRAIRALRRGHIAGEAFGVQTPRAKLLVFIYAAVLAGLSGWLYAHFQRAANPTPFGAHAGIEYLFIAVVGGAGYVWGAVLGAGIVVTILRTSVVCFRSLRSDCGRSLALSSPRCLRLRPRRLPANAGPARADVAAFGPLLRSTAPQGSAGWWLSTTSVSRCTQATSSA